MEGLTSLHIGPWNINDESVQFDEILKKGPKSLKCGGWVPAQPGQLKFDEGVNKREWLYKLQTSLAIETDPWGVGSLLNW